MVVTKKIPVETMLEWPTSCLSKIIQVLMAYQYLQRKTFMLDLSTADYYLEFILTKTGYPTPAPTCAFRVISSSLKVSKLSSHYETITLKSLTLKLI